MKKRIARLLVKWAQKLNPSVAFENAPNVRQMSITLHITKKDVKEWRKEHPECKSHRQGLKSIIEEAKWQVAGSIGRGLMKSNAIDFEIHKTLYVADVSGSIYLYAQSPYGSEENGTAATTEATDAE